MEKLIFGSNKDTENMDIGNMTDQSNVQFKASKRGEVVDASTSSG
jgi:hypothetical protein